MAQEHDPFAAALRSAETWLDVVADELGTDDRQLAHRTLRAWLHTVRDQLSIGSTAHLGAQLPELLRGELYDSWAPAHGHPRRDREEFIDQFAQLALIDPDTVPDAAAGVTTALRGLCSSGQIEKALGTLPRPLRTVLAPDLEPMVRDRMSERVAELEESVSVLSQALLTLTHGLAEAPIVEPVAERTANAARQAQHLLLTDHR